LQWEEEGLFQFFGGLRRCNHSDVFEEDQAVLNRFEMVEDLTKCVVVDVSSVLQVG
jgi:hypothetical protein